MKNFLPFQILISALVVNFIIRVINKKNEDILKPVEFFGWNFLWVLVLLVLWWPGTLSLAANVFGIGRGVDLAIYLALMLLFFMIFRLYVKLDRQQQEITILTRKIAISEQDKYDAKQ